MTIRKKWLGIVVLTVVTLFTVKYLTSGDGKNLNIPKVVDFNQHIRPILSQNCYTCHGPDTSSRKADLRLDTREGAIALLASGKAAVVPGRIRKSEMIHRITSADPTLQMPPPEAKKQLNEREIALIKKWIRQGAEWKKHWAFIPPRFPEMSDKANPSAIIDQLIEKSQKVNKLQPAARAGKSSLIRRIAYLLTGLPPTPKAIQAFTEDPSADAYEKMVDKYLASPHFGERWARHWMDLVRYGEHMGHEFDYPISGAWQYRDYLIRAFNADVPYDQLVKEHLAGDILSDPRYHPEEHFNESIIGTAYFFLGEGKHSPVSIKQEEADRIDNMIDVTSKTFQALTVACARCHDHKFDPVSAKDYYAMYGMIESARIGPQAARQTQQQQAIVQRIRNINQQIRTEIGQRLAAALEPPSPQLISQQKQFIDQLPAEEAGYKVIGDFRQTEWNGWFADGMAFGKRPLQGAPQFDLPGERLIDLTDGMASSRTYGPGVMGVLRSPNFIVEHDSIAVRARGLNGSIRIIVNNFQLIRYPLYGSFERIVEEEKWQTYVLDVSIAKGSKAYVEILPGRYHNHNYEILPADYIEVQYVIAYDSAMPDWKQQLVVQTNATQNLGQQALDNWIQNKATPQELKLIASKVKDQPVTPALTNLLAQKDSMAHLLYDSTHFLGLTEGNAVFSPVFLRGSINQLSEEKVSHQFLSAVEAGPAEYPQKGSGRLAWAEAVVDPSNPLTARVMVNRIWHHLFGKGIVESVDNFGLQGKLPSHPALLDYLALQFIEEGWSIKQMIRYIVLSETFQRSTKALEANQSLDPDNIYLHHFPVRRLEAEAIRDGILAVSGSLDPQMYGEPVAMHITEFMTGRGRPRTSGPLDGAGRRSIYLAVRRNFLSPFLLVFDLPIPFSTFGRRNTTNVPAQSLTLLNDPFVHLQAERWAEKILAGKKRTLEERVQDIYWSAFARQASAKEMEGARTYLADLAEEYGSSLEDMKDNPQLWKDYCHSIFNLKEFIFLL